MRILTDITNSQIILNDCQCGNDIRLSHTKTDVKKFLYTQVVIPPPFLFNYTQWFNSLSLEIHFNGLQYTLPGKIRVFKIISEFKFLN